MSKHRPLSLKQELRVAALAESLLPAIVGRQRDRVINHYMGGVVVTGDPYPSTQTMISEAFYAAKLFVDACDARQSAAEDVNQLRRERRQLAKKKRR